MINIPIRVRNLIKKWGTRNPFKLCEYLGIIVLFIDLGENTKGFYQKIKGKKVIVININLDEFAKRVACSHELGHVVCHSSKQVQFSREHTLLPKNSIYEREANKFAAELLVDENDDEYIYECDIDFKVLEELKELKYKNKLY